MSRALNIDAPLAEVVAMAAQHKIIISAIEPLYPDGTRVVFANSNDAAAIAQVYGKRVLTGRVTRKPWNQRRVS